MPVHKTDKANLRVRYPLMVEIGLIISLGILIVAFRVNIQSNEDFQISLQDQETVQMEEIVQTQQVEKPPPPPRPPVPVEVPNDEVLDDVDLDLDVTLDIDEPLSALPPPPPPPVEEVVEEPEPEIFIIVEQMPCLLTDKGDCNGNDGLIDLQKKISYPPIARQAGVEGRVTLQFVVNEQGRVTDPVVIRGIGAGCDEEAVKAVLTARFSPGKQRGKAVKVKMSLPITFKLK